MALKPSQTLVVIFGLRASSTGNNENDFTKHQHVLCAESHPGETERSKAEDLTTTLGVTLGVCEERYSFLNLIKLYAVVRFSSRQMPQGHCHRRV